jgi:hypothetical protein
MASDKDYMAEYRKNHPQYMAEQKKRQRARNRADIRLRAEYPAQWSALLKEELKKEGIE